MSCRFIPRIRFTFRLVIIPAPVSSADAVYPRFAGLTMFIPLIVSIAPDTEPVRDWGDGIHAANQRA